MVGNANNHNMLLYMVVVVDVVVVVVVILGNKGSIPPETLLRWMLVNIDLSIEPDI